jgi:hypothetical protein
MSFSKVSSKLAISVAVGVAVGLAGLGGSYVIPLDNEAIQYTTRPVDDPISRLQKDIDGGKLRLNYDDTQGYLASVLRALDVPQESQVLVFSKTSFQAPRIGPRMPRALYFNDRVSVGFVRGGDVLEIAAQDPKQGIIFYTLDQERVSKPKFERRDTCLQCHQSGSTLGVPGLFMVSVFPETSGMPLFQSGTTVVNQTKPIEQRWGGWYVTGQHGEQKHRGNALVRDKSKPDELETERTQNQTDLSSKFDTGAYLTPHSDIAALMVFEHQAHMTNLITRVGFEARMAVLNSNTINKALGEPTDKLSESAVRRINNACEEMVEYMLFAGEAPIKSPIKGTAGFEKAFASAGPRDSKGRSFRDLDLTRRMFKYPLSYMIYSEAFKSMPEEARTRVLTRISELLTSTKDEPLNKHLSLEDRKAILEIATESGAFTGMTRPAGNASARN